VSVNGLCLFVVQILNAEEESKKVSRRGLSGKTQSEMYRKLEEYEMQQSLLDILALELKHQQAVLGDLAEGVYGLCVLRCLDVVL